MESNVSNTLELTKNILFKLKIFMCIKHEKILLSYLHLQKNNQMVYENISQEFQNHSKVIKLNSGFYFNSKP